MIRYEVAKRIAEDFNKAMKRMKKMGLDISDAPKEVQEAILALHQNALLVCDYERRMRKKDASSKETSARENP